MRKFGRGIYVFFLVAAAALACAAALPKPGNPPDHVDMTWMSIANMFYEAGPLGIVTDGYISRIPQAEFWGGGGGLAYTHKPTPPNVDAVRRVINAVGGPGKINLLLTGHSHFDHSFDTATW